MSLHLREVVVVQRMVSTGFEAQNARVGFRWPLGAGMEEHLARLSGPANRLPFQFIAVTGFHRLMFSESRIVKEQVRTRKKPASKG